MKETSYLKLFLKFLKIGLFGFGGGYAILGFIQREIVKSDILQEEDFKESIALSQFSPGAMITNTILNIGYKLKGIYGSLISFLGFILPSFIIVVLISKIYVEFNNKIFLSILSGINPAIIAILISVIINLFKIGIKTLRDITIIILTISLIYLLKIEIIFLIFLGAIAGIIFCILQKKELSNVAEKKNGQPVSLFSLIEPPFIILLGILVGIFVISAFLPKCDKNLSLFNIFLKIGLFGFGGGYGMLPLMNMSL